MPRLNGNLQAFVLRTGQLEALVDGIAAAPPQYQSSIGELIFLRLFSMLEIELEDVTTKIVCGARYLDGTAPVLLHQSRSVALARDAMRKHGRSKALELKWTIGTDIRANVKFVIDPSDPYFVAVTTHEARIDEMRRIRNHIAHSNSDTLRKYKPVVVAHYGAYVPRITPAVLLQSGRFRPTLLKQYLAAARIIIKEFVRA